MSGKVSCATGLAAAAGDAASLSFGWAPTIVTMASGPQRWQIRVSIHSFLQRSPQKTNCVFPTSFRSKRTTSAVALAGTALSQRVIVAKWKKSLGMMSLHFFPLPFVHVRGGGARHGVQNPMDCFVFSTPFAMSPSPNDALATLQPKQGREGIRGPFLFK